MPYAARKKDGSDAWEVVNTETKEVKATYEPPDSEEKAKSQVRLLEQIENDPTWDEE
jgi:hypothetical protein